MDGVETVDTHTARTNCAGGGYTGTNGRDGFRVGRSVCFSEQLVLASEHSYMNQYAGFLIYP